VKWITISFQVATVRIRGAKHPLPHVEVKLHAFLTSAVHESEWLGVYMQGEKKMDCN
jgi:hypothetical protein